MDTKLEGNTQKEFQEPRGGNNKYHRILIYFTVGFLIFIAISIVFITKETQKKQSRSIQSHAQSTNPILTQRFIQGNPYVGAHVAIQDSPTNIVRLDKLFKNLQSEENTKMNNAFDEINLSAIRIFDAPWWSPNGAKKVYESSSYFDLNFNREEQEYISSYNSAIVNGFEIMDNANKGNRMLSMVVDVTYFDQESNRYYETVQTANNPIILQRAARENAGKFVQYYLDHNYSFPFVLEIGNETIGYGPDKNPNGTEYGKIASAYCVEIYKRSQGKVKCAVYIDFPSIRDVGQKGIDGYYVFNRALLTELKNAQAPVDYAVTHLYTILQRSAEVDTHLTRLSNLLNDYGFSNTKFLITEYDIDTYSTKYFENIYSKDLIQASAIAKLVANERVAGFFYHNLAQQDVLNYSNGTYWSKIYAPQLQKGGHPSDSKGGELGPRWRIMPLGLAIKMFNELLGVTQITNRTITTSSTNIADFEYPTTTLLTVQGEKYKGHIFINTTDESKRSNIPIIADSSLTVNAKVLTSSSLGPETDELNQPWIINETKNYTTVPPRSILLVKVYGDQVDTKKEVNQLLLKVDFSGSFENYEYKPSKTEYVNGKLARTVGNETMENGEISLNGNVSGLHYLPQISIDDGNLINTNLVIETIAKKQMKI